MIRFAATGSFQTLTPLIATEPMSGRSRPVIMDRDVVLPAPFGPTSPLSDPWAMSRLIPATASFAPKLLRSPRTAIAGSSRAADGAPTSPAGSVMCASGYCHSGEFWRIFRRIRPACAHQRLYLGQFPLRS
jgi:hypothetical protein